MSYATNVVQSQCLSIISINIYHSFSMYNVVEWLTPVTFWGRFESAGR